MITKENLKEVLSKLTPEDLDTVEQSQKDFVGLRLSIFNVGYRVELTMFDYDEEIEEEYLANGNIFCDKDNFGELLKVLD